MGFWGTKLYQSDQALDYFSTITDLLEREMAYWFSPEQVRHEAWWLGQALAVVELMLLFEQHDKGSSVYVQSEAAAARWREVFLQVWDGDWGHEPEPYDPQNPLRTPEQRQQERLMALAMFDYLHTIAHFWTQIGMSGSKPELAPMQLPHPLPYFSLRTPTRFTSDLFGHLEREIIYWLSLEKRSEIFWSDVVEVWVAVDVLGFLSERYERTPGVNATTVQVWREKTVDIWKDSQEGDEQAWDENDPLLVTVMGVFDHLACMAEKYPPMEW
jgi:hypothetical protein